MATKTSTCGAGAFKFEDPTGIQHVISTSQTFTFDFTDGGASAVVYRENGAQSVTTTDGRTLVFRPSATPSTNTSGSTNSVNNQWGPTADAQDATAVLSLAGELVTEFTEGGIHQIWKAETLTVDNVDAPGEMNGRWKDQFGRYMDWVGITVA